MIICCGEALIDMLPRETAQGAACFQPFPGGSVLNTAVTLGRLGTPVGMFTGLSSDLFGDQLSKFLRASGVDLSLVHHSARPTTLAFVTLVNGQARYAFYDENTAGRMLGRDDLPDIPESVTALFFGGISLMVEPAAATYEALMLRAASTRPVMLDPNIRPDFISDEATYRARLDRLLAAATIVKVSDEDLHWIMGDGPLEECAEALRARGPAIVCVTEGAKGVRAVSSAGVTAAAATKVAVVDTVGAGDTFNGAFLSALHASGSLDKAALATLPQDRLAEALAHAGRAAAVTVSREGANPPWAEELA